MVFFPRQIEIGENEGFTPENDIFEYEPYDDETNGTSRRSFSCCL